ncbi:MAG: cytochrome c biogenesis protein CcsA, partial [Deferrisomatales bacterium]|nr:cytochrome c biogenesis protein CcsA [Deferrisomatales bacterium]
MNVTVFNASLVAYLLASVLYAVFAAARRNRLVGLAATAALLVGFLANSAGFVIRYLESHQAGFAYMPLSNMYESMVFFAWSIVGIYLLFEWKYGVRALGTLVAPLGALSIALVSLNPAISTELQPLVPALQSNWLTSHVVTCFIGYAAFAVAFAASGGYLVKGNKGEGFLPAGKVLDEIAYKGIAVGFPFLTLGILTGAAWANYAWGTYWSWDP